MKRALKVLGWLVAGIVVVFGALTIIGEGQRRDEAVRAAVDAALADARASLAAEQAVAIETAVNAAVAAAVEQAVAEAEARVLAELPPLPEVNTALDIDEETLALFPKGAYLRAVGDDYESVRCGDYDPDLRVEWVRLDPDGVLRSTVERQEPRASDFLIGLLSFGLSAFAGPAKPVQTIFASRTEGAYTTLILGALRGNSEPELVVPQFRLTLYRIDQSSFGVVERAPLDVPPAARPDNGQPRIVQILRRCAYRNGSSVDLT